MKLNTESTGNAVKTNIVGTSKQFGIKNTAVVIDILRNRLYRHPIRTLVQEYISNGRDANREAKKASTPIRVTLPTQDEPTFKVRDFGPGLSPERIEEVFLYYGSSTKRDSDEQTGGFGIGAKSAWAYTDSFVIISYIDGQATHYVADTGKSKQGELKVISQTATKEPNGVEIQIGVAEDDINSFVNAAERATYFWDVRPEFVNDDSLSFEYSSAQVLDEGKKYKVIKGLDDSYIEGDTKLALVIDGIIYELPESFSEDKKIAALNDFVKSGRTVFLRVDTGFCEINASREDITDKKESIKKVSALSALVLKEIIEGLHEHMQSAKTVKAFFENYKNVMDHSNADDVKFEAKIDGFTFTALEEKISSDFFNEFEIFAYTGRKTRRSNRINREKVNHFKIEDDIHFVHDDGVYAENQRKHRIGYFFKQLSRVNSKAIVYVLSPLNSKDHSKALQSLNATAVSEINVIVNRPMASGYKATGPKQPTNKNIIGINKIVADYRNVYVTNESTDISALTAKDNYVYLSKPEFEALKKQNPEALKEMLKYFSKKGLKFVSLAERYVGWVQGNKRFETVSDYVMKMSPKSYAALQSELEAATIRLACREHDGRSSRYYDYGDSDDGKMSWARLNNLMFKARLEKIKDDSVTEFSDKVFSLQKQFKTFESDAEKIMPTYLLNLFFQKDASLKKFKTEFESFFKYMEKEYPLAYHSTASLSYAKDKEMNTVATELVIYINAKFRG